MATARGSRAVVEIIAMSRKLTDAERKTLNDAWAIIGTCTAIGSSWSFDSARYRFSPDTHNFSLTYFDSNEGAERGQHNLVRGETFADKVQTVLEIEASAFANRDQAKTARIEALRKELSELGQAA